MPQPRRYATRALQQAAYRKRQAAARDEQLRAKGLPALPAPPQIPGRVRWRSAIETAGAVLEQTAAEMQDYYADRSEEWQESERAEALLEQIGTLEEVIDKLHTLNES